MPAPFTTFAAVLAAQLRKEPGRPFITFYDHASGERVELSLTTYANWVAKASGLLADECDLERGDTLRIDLPVHWLSPVFLGAAWTLGLVLSDEDSPDAVVCGPDELPRWADRAGDIPVLACSLRPLGVRFEGPVPADVRDVGLEIWGQPDGFTAWDPPTGEDLAWRTHAENDAQMTQAELIQAATDGSVLTAGGRLLSVSNPASPPEFDTFTEPLVKSGSLVLVAHPDATRLEETAKAERATARR